MSSCRFINEISHQPYSALVLFIFHRVFALSFCTSSKPTFNTSWRCLSLAGLHRLLLLSNRPLNLSFRACTIDWRKRFAGSRGERVSRWTGGQSRHPHKWLASRKILSVEKLETLPVGTKPRTSRINRLEERGVERGSARRSSLKGQERAIVNPTNTGTVSGKGNVGETSERRGGAHMGFFELIDTILN